jgi:hypothetical protein
LIETAGSFKHLARIDDPRNVPDGYILIEVERPGEHAPHRVRARDVPGRNSLIEKAVDVDWRSSIGRGVGKYTFEDRVKITNIFNAPGINGITIRTVPCV